MIELWKSIPGFVGRYQASNQGRVRSVDRPVRTVARSGTETIRYAKGKILANQKHSHGYAQISMGSVILLVHTVVMLTFRGPRPDGHQIAHGNRDRADNRLANLRYATPTENAHDKILHGTSGLGETNAAAKLTSSEVGEIIALVDAGIPTADLATLYGIHQHSVSRLARRERWGHLHV
jgi:hypothetical protein